MRTCTDLAHGIDAGGYYSATAAVPKRLRNRHERRYTNGETRPMPSAPVIDAIAATSHGQPGNGRREASIVPVGPGEATQPARQPVPLFHIPRTVPTARIHWIGRFVKYRHPADLYQEMLEGKTHLVVVDARYPEAYARERLPGAISLPWRELDEARAAHLPRDARYVVYCWDASCRASTKAADRMESLGFDVNELHGGLQAWKKQGYPTERG
jgi:rhodanese-related sulfurtransferase